MKLLIKRLLLGRASQKQKLQYIHFIVNIGFSKAYYSKNIHVNVFKLSILTNFEVVFLVIWFIS
jgi:dimeric dUTPase (all-alpha-NTP-PPase superfamily)